MSQVGTETDPLRVAIIGSGPAGFYTVSNLLRHRDVVVEMDMYDRLPTPYGLVRAGVAPDHQKYKTVTRAYDKSAQVSNFHFFGGVEYGTHIHLEDLKRHYHQVVFTTGSPSDRNLGIPGESLAGSHSATDFVAWYNGHPDYVDYRFDLSQENVAIVGLGNVAIDVARILCKTYEELAQTDIADHALAALKDSRVKNIIILGRRGPVQAAFTPPEIKEMGELIDADVTVPVDEATLDKYSEKQLAEASDKNIRKNVDIIDDFAGRELTDKSRHLTIRFLVSPKELIDDGNGAVKAIRIVRNEPYLSDDGTVRPRATETEEVIPVGLVFRSVGYHGIALPEVPFNESRGTIRHEQGRILNDDDSPVVGLYTAGWIKRGPTGVIGTNKTDARQTVDCMIEDLAKGQHLEPQAPDTESLLAFIKERQPDYFSYQDWADIDEVEVARGQESGRPRVKFTDVASMLTVLNR